MMSTDLSDTLLPYNSETQNTNHHTTTLIDKRVNNNSNSTRRMSNGSSEGEAPREETSGGFISTLNILNVGAYLLYLFVNYGVSTLGWLGNVANAVPSEKYQTLLTPKPFVFHIWFTIFASQTNFVVAQCLPRFRSSEVVQKGIGYYWISVCVMQASWTLAYACDVVWLSFIITLLVWASLIVIVSNQYSIRNISKEQDDDEDDVNRFCDFWLLYFPFEIHCGWMTVASVLNFNVLVVNFGAHNDVQLAIGIVSLAILLAISVWTTWGLSNPNYSIGAVLSWATYWICKELQDPKDSITERFGNGDLVFSVALAARAVAAIILLQILVRVMMWKKMERIYTGVLVDDEGEEEAKEGSQNSTETDEEEEEGQYEPLPFRGKSVQESYEAPHALYTTIMDTSDLEGGR